MLPCVDDVVNKENYWNQFSRFKPYARKRDDFEAVPELCSVQCTPITLKEWGGDRYLRDYDGEFQGWETEHAPSILGVFINNRQVLNMQLLKHGGPTFHI